MNCKIISFSLSLLFITALTGCVHLPQQSSLSSDQNQKIIYSFPEENVQNGQPIVASARDNRNEHFSYSESRTNWTQMISEGFAAYKYATAPEVVRKSSPIESALAVKQDWSQYCQLKDWKIIHNNDYSVTYSTYLVNCKPNFMKQLIGTQQEQSVFVATKFFKSTNGAYILAYYGLPSAWSASREKQVLKILKNAHLEPISPLHA